MYEVDDLSIKYQDDTINKERIKMKKSKGYTDDMYVNELSSVERKNVCQKNLLPGKIN